MEAAILYALETSVRRSAQVNNVPYDILRLAVQRRRLEQYQAQLPQWDNLLVQFIRLKRIHGVEQAIHQITQSLEPRYRPQFERRARSYKPPLSRQLQDSLNKQIFRVREEARRTLNSQMSPSLYLAIEKWSLDETEKLTQRAHEIAEQFM